MTMFNSYEKLPEGIYGLAGGGDCPSVAEGTHIIIIKAQGWRTASAPSCALRGWTTDTYRRIARPSPRKFTGFLTGYGKIGPKSSWTSTSWSGSSPQICYELLLGPSPIVEPWKIMVCFSNLQRIQKPSPSVGPFIWPHKPRSWDPNTCLNVHPKYPKLLKWITIISYHHITTTLDMEHLGTSLVIHGLLLRRDFKGLCFGAEIHRIQAARS